MTFVADRWKAAGCTGGAGASDGGYDRGGAKAAGRAEALRQALSASPSPLAGRKWRRAAPPRWGGGQLFPRGLFKASSRLLSRRGEAFRPALANTHSRLLLPPALDDSVFTAASAKADQRRWSVFGLASEGVVWSVGGILRGALTKLRGRVDRRPTSAALRAAISSPPAGRGMRSGPASAPQRGRLPSPRLGRSRRRSPQRRQYNRLPSPRLGRSRRRSPQRRQYIQLPSSGQQQMSTQSSRPIDFASAMSHSRRLLQAV